MGRRQRLMIGMSGGVDSSVSAYLLKERGYEVVGATFLLDPAMTKESATAAKNAAELIGMEHHVIDLREEFQEEVIRYFVSEYSLGRTPNPCIHCNRHIKFGLFFDAMSELGAEKIATGHYARVEEENGHFVLKTAKDLKKDQTYFLYHLTQEQLKKTNFPLFGLEKGEIREIAMKIGLESHNAPDSEEICFIHGESCGAFIQRFTGEPLTPGNIVDPDGNVLGTHSGIENYTIGQRRGLGVATGKRVFVTSIDAEANQVVLGGEELLFSNVLIATQLSFISGDPPQGRFRCEGKIRYSVQRYPLTAELLSDGRMKVEFDEPVRAITKGQSVVLYDGDIVLGGGVISDIPNER